MADEVARRAELADNLGEVRGRLEQACAAAGRNVGEVSLVAVTKTWPAADVVALAELGIRDVGENRDQEAAAKHAVCLESSVAGIKDVRWHFIGQVQTNKARSIARYSDIVQAVDRSAVVVALSRGAEAAQRRVGVCLQVSLEQGPAGEQSPARGGVMPRDVEGLADEVESAPHIDLLGLMTVAPLGEEPRSAYERFAGVVEDFQRNHPQATLVSAGMSGDLEAAVASGATHVRIGTALLGHRPKVR